MSRLVELQGAAAADAAAANVVLAVAVAGHADTRARTPRFVLDVLVVSGDGENPPVLPTSLDAFVAVFVECGKVLPEIFVCGRDGIALAHCREPEGQVPQRGRVKFVLMRLI